MWREVPPNQCQWVFVLWLLATHQVDEISDQLEENNPVGRNAGLLGVDDQEIQMSKFENLPVLEEQEVSAGGGVHGEHEFGVYGEQEKPGGFSKKQNDEVTVEKLKCGGVYHSLDNGEGLRMPTCPQEIDNILKQVDNINDMDYVVYSNYDQEGHHEPQGEGAGVSTPSKSSSYQCQGSQSDGQLVSIPAGSPLPFSLSFAPKSRKKARPKFDHLDLSLGLASEIYNLSNPDVPWDETIAVVEKENGKTQGRSRRVRKGVRVSRFKLMLPVEIIDRLA